MNSRVEVKADGSVRSNWVKVNGRKAKNWTVLEQNRQSKMTLSGWPMKLDGGCPAWQIQMFKNQGYCKCIM